LTGATIHKSDLFDPAAIDRLIDAVRPTHILHFAWIATPKLYWVSAENFSWVAASLHLVRAFHRSGGSRAVLAGELRRIRLVARRCVPRRFQCARNECGK
jgi:hypothetical protein